MHLKNTSLIGDHGVYQVYISCFSRISQRIRSNHRAGFPRRVKEVVRLTAHAHHLLLRLRMNATTPLVRLHGFDKDLKLCRLVSTITIIAYYLSHVRPTVLYLSVCSACISVALCWTHFRKIRYWRLSVKYAEKIKIWLK